MDEESYLLNILLF